MSSRLNRHAIFGPFFRKGITHDHIFNLRSAGLLNVHVVGETVSTYSLRVEQIQQIEQGLFDYLGMNPSLLSHPVNEME